MRNVLSTLLLAAVLATSCETYEPPPDVALVGADNGVLTDTNAPIVVWFTEPVKPSSIRARIVKFTTDDTGHLTDEDAQPGSPDLLFSYSPEAVTGGKATLADDRQSLSITLDTAPTVGQRFVLVVDAGLEDDAGRKTGNRRRIVFGFDFQCGVDKVPTKLPSGDYFLLVAVEHPLGIQLRLFGHLDIDPMTGRVVGQFTDAVRNRDPSRCPGGCKSTDACQTIPAPKCVTPSTNAGSTDEYVDYLPSASPPFGFTFAATGCARDQADGTTAFAIAPVDVQVQQPRVTAKNITLSASFRADASGIVRGQGSLRATDMLLGDISSGPGDGTLTAQLIPDGTAPGDIPKPASPLTLGHASIPVLARRRAFRRRANREQRRSGEEGVCRIPGPKRWKPMRSEGDRQNPFHPSAPPLLPVRPKAGLPRGLEWTNNATMSLPPNVRILGALPGDHAAFDVSDDRAMRALAAAEERHFWHRARNRLIGEHLARLGILPGARVLELGCGGGGVSAYLASAGYRVTGVDGHLSLVTRAATRAPGASFVVHDLAAGPPDLGEAAFDATCLFDVIEHLDDPRRAIEDALAMTREGGVVVGTVPALMSLWSGVDVQAGHRLRYDEKTLEIVLRGVAGARLVEVVPFNRALVPMLWLQRRMVVREGDVGATSEQNFAVPPRPVNATLYALARAEAKLAPLLDKTPLPGSSLWFAVRKA